MDTSETYIKMRLAAIPDLGRGKSPSLALSNDGFAWVDYAVFIDRLGNFYYSRVNLEPLGEELKACQLERQDQLQEMVGGFEAGFIDWFHWRNAVYPHMQNPFNKEWRFDSYEQLWLAFAMKENHNKVWSSEGWVNE